MIILLFIIIMLNPLIDKNSIATEQIKIEDKDKNKSQTISDDCSWCIFCDFGCLFTCCLE